LVKYVGESKEASYDSISSLIAIVFLPLIVLYFRTKRRKD